MNKRTLFALPLVFGLAACQDPRFGGQACGPMTNPAVTTGVGALAGAAIGAASGNRYGNNALGGALAGGGLGLAAGSIGQMGCSPMYNNQAGYGQPSYGVPGKPGVPLQGGGYGGVRSQSGEFYVGNPPGVTTYQGYQYRGGQETGGYTVDRNGRVSPARVQHY